MDVLKIIKRHHIARLLKKYKVGAQILFEYNLENWRQAIGIPLDNALGSNGSTLLINPSAQNPSRHQIQSSPTPSMISTHSPSPILCADDDTNIETVTINKILNETSKGIMVLDYYKKKSYLEAEQRTALINIITQYFEDRGIQLSLAISYRMEKEILEMFPTEKLVH